MVDIANATLSGGVAVGAVADLMLQPYGAFIAGTICGALSTIGFRKLQGSLLEKLKLHDSCGVLNLHGGPGVFSGLFSILMCAIATEEVYGPGLYLLFPHCAPEADSSELKALQAELPQIEAGEGRSVAIQAAYQAVALGVTLVVAIVTGCITGYTDNHFLKGHSSQFISISRPHPQHFEPVPPDDRLPALQRRPLF